MKPNEGRRRVMIEEVQPTVDAGRTPAKRVMGDTVAVTAVIFSDGHDHISARLLYRHASQRKWQMVPFTALVNDMWMAEFPAAMLGSWKFTIEAWVDHFDTWVSDLAKRLEAQETSAQDIPLALRIGAGHIDAAASRAKGPDAKRLAGLAAEWRRLAEANRAHYESPITSSVLTLMNKYPDTEYATLHATEYPIWVDRERARFSAWYELFPRSASDDVNRHGTFADVEARLPEIAAMGFDILYMPPIHPVGTAYRKGKNNSTTAEPGDVGSPWAVGAADGGHTEILSELGSFADFGSLLTATHQHGMEIALDIAFQCSPDHPWVKSHPEWFIHRPDGTIQYAENPPKKYQDIYPLNFESANWRGLWDALHNVFEFWIDHGVRVFRVDNPHTKALPFWEWCITEIQKSAPDTIFLAEAFTRPHVTYSLAKGGFTQSYTYFTWRNTKADLQEYLEEITVPPISDFFRPNFWPNTPDILHAQFQVEDLAERRAIFQQRVILAATLSSNYGIYGPAYELLEGRPAKPSAGKTSSEEYLDSEKYQLRVWDRADPSSIAPLITQLNAIRRENSALQRNETLAFHPIANQELLCYSKSSLDGRNTILVVVNLDPVNEQGGFVELSLEKLNVPSDAAFQVEDLLTGTFYTWSGTRNYIALTPGATAHVLRVVR